ncbi:MAG: N-acetyltransferase family protein [Gemmataceae bacterium]
MTLLIRPAAEADLGAVRDIYNHYVAHSTCTFQVEPDTEAERLAWFRGRGPSRPVTVADFGGVVVGWAALSTWNSRCAYARTAEASVYVHPEHHRRGVGRTLLADLIARGRAAGLHTIVGGTCTEHTASLALQAAFGFREVGVLREVGHKFGRWLDVAYTQLILDPQT